MAEVKWIKIVADIFDDEKMLLIESLPSADSLIVIWFKLLCLAGKNNNNGVFILNDKIPYTDEMLATIFRRDVNTVRLALKTFEDFGMILIVDGVITIPNWGKHQTLDRLEARKEYMKGYMQKYRDKQKAKIECVVNKNSLQDANSNANCKANVNEADKDNKDNKEYEKEINKEKPTKRKHKYGEFNHVLLLDSEYERLGLDYGEDMRAKAITFLDEYIEEKGAKYKSHYMAIRRWVVNAVKERESKGKPDYSKNKFNQMIKSNYDFDAIEKEILQ